MARIGASGQDYLEAILELSQQAGEIRSVDIAELLGVSRASVNRAIGNLKQAGLVEHERYSSIRMTESGKLMAQSVQERHTILKSFLMDVLGVCEAIAQEDACKMEHSLSGESLEKLKIFMDNQKSLHDGSSN